jgi:hypothetical protein
MVASQAQRAGNDSGSTTSLGVTLGSAPTNGQVGLVFTYNNTSNPTADLSYAGWRSLGVVSSSSGANITSWVKPLTTADQQVVVKSSVAIALQVDYQAWDGLEYEGLSFEVVKLLDQRDTNGEALGTSQVLAVGTATDRTGEVVFVVGAHAGDATSGHTWTGGVVAYTDDYAGGPLGRLWTAHEILASTATPTATETYPSLISTGLMVTLRPALAAVAGQTSGGFLIGAGHVGEDYIGATEGAPTVTGTAAAASTVTATVAALVTVPATAAATGTVTATVAATPEVLATAAAASTVTATAAGAVTAPGVSGTAAAASSAAATVSATPEVLATSAVTNAVTATASALVEVPASVLAAGSVAATVSATPEVLAVVSASSTVTATAGAIRTLAGSALATNEVTATAVAAVPAPDEDPRTAKQRRQRRVSPINP